MAVKNILKADGNSVKEKVEVEGLEGIPVKYLTFEIDSESYGIEIKDIVQIIEMQDITFVPEQAEYVKGVINLRGQIIPVIEVRVRLKKQPIEYDDRTCIIVVSHGDMMVGLIVDRVSEVLNIKENQIAETPKLQKEKNVEYIHGIAHLNNCIIMLLDIRKMLDMEV
ncbi:MAG: chemotaxis protein CheW [Peptostreptococcales bacterium]